MGIFSKRPHFPHMQCLLHAAELSPDEGYMKFLYLGQLHSGEEAAQYLTTAIDIMKRGREVSGEKWEGGVSGEEWERGEW